MKKTIFSLLAAGFLAYGSPLAAQTKSVWTLQDCLTHAATHNIQVQKSRVAEQEGEVTLKQQRAALFPTLSASISQSLQYRPFQDAPSSLVSNGMATSSSNKLTHSGNYGLNASWTLWNGGANVKNIRAQKLTNRLNELATEQTVNSIQEQIAQLYVQVLYSQEAIGVNKALLESAQKQYDRGREMLAQGLISRADLTQLEAQLSSSRYDVVSAETQTAQYKLQLKTLLELEPGQTFDIAPETPADEAALALIPAQEEVLNEALALRPEIRSSELGLEAADLNIDIARAAYHPTLSLNAGIGDSHYSASSDAVGEQMKQNLNGSLGLTVSMPLFDNRRNKSTLEKAKLGKLNSQLDLQDRRNELSSTIESYWLNAHSSQQRFNAACSNAELIQAGYDLLDEQFRHGLKNIVELLTGRDNLLTAQQDRLQSKYTAILNRLLLDFYRGGELKL